MSIDIKGLDLSEGYYRAYGQPMIDRLYPEYSQRIASGLVGDGSDCLGFDDELSRDHDWGPGFCLWLTDEDYDRIGPRLEQDYNGLQREFKGYKRIENEWGSKRTGVFRISEFYKALIGIPAAPDNIYHWLKIPEKYFVTAVSGRVFSDPLGQFTEIRNKILAHYPEPVRRVKIAARCMYASQSWPYTWLRSRQRDDQFSMSYSLVKFVTEIMMIIYLINRRYAPYYKWMHRGLLELPTAGKIFHAHIEDLMNSSDADLQHRQMQVILTEIIGLLKKEGLSDSNSCDLSRHGESIKQTVEDGDLRSLDIWSA